MKIRALVFGIILASLFQACSTDVDLYADYQSIPVVYGFINQKADTNYIKITRTFCGTNEEHINAMELAAIADSSNYPDKLDVFFEELKSSSGQPFEPTGRRFQLDTLTIHNKKEGLFYAPHQKLYYTTEHFNTTQNNDKYRYKLTVVKPDGERVTSELDVIEGDIFLGQVLIHFESFPSDRHSRIMFTSTEEAVLYEIGMQFNYWEGHDGQPLTQKQVSWSYGSRPIGAYEKIGDLDNLYGLSYSVNALFDKMKQAIGNDTVWDANHPNVVRYIGDFYIYISAAGKDFYNYSQYLQTMQGGLSLSNEYTNIKGGCGFLSSRVFVKHKVELTSRAKYDLFSLPWGFREQ